VLRRATALWLGLAVCVGLAANAQDDADGLVRPERLTIGTSDQFLGTLSPDGRTLYYASTRNTTTELFAQDLTAGSSSLLFDEGADVTWPRVSADGKHILYISYREDAAGQLCVRELPKGERRCLRGDSGAVQAQWIDARHILLLSRPAQQGDMRVSTVEVDRRLSARTLFDRNLTGPAVSPDGRWLVYTPMERYVERIGPGFAAKAGRALVAQRLDRPTAPPVTLALDAPGLTGQAAFSRDGRWLYFVQFVSDSNQDGTIDASDHGVLFKIAFDAARDDAPNVLTGIAPQQLTDASWNCQYPSPGAQRLIATCSRSGHLDIYGLPLSGMVPEDWGADRLRAELDVTTSAYEQLLLHAQRLQVERDPSQRRSEMISLIRLHLQHDEFDAADFHAKHVAALKDKATSGLGTAMRVLCEYRRALRARERGRLSLDFIPESRKRLIELAASKASSPAGDAMRHILRSEIADVLGDPALARSELEAVVLDGITLTPVLELYVDRADALYRALDEREALLAAYQKLTVHPALSATDRLGFARAAARTLVRGLSRSEAEAALAAVTPPDSDLAFAYELMRAVSAVQDAKPSEEVRERIIALYRRESRPERRRAVILESMQRGWERGAHSLLQRLAELYVDDAPKGTIERRRAARMYRRLVEDRAYTKLSVGKTAEARDDFLAVARRVGSLESWAGYIDQRLKEGAKVEELEAEYGVPGDDKGGKKGNPKTNGGAPNGAVKTDGSTDKNGPVGRFVRAYLLARKLPKLAGAEATRASDQAVALLRGAWSQLKDKPEAVSVMGSVLHERFLHTQDRAAAQRASALYLIALDLGRRNPRYQATLLEQMALLQAQVGNWRIAIDYFDQREKLPFVDNLAGLAHRLIKARTLLHIDREEEAAKLTDEALAIVERTPRMAPFRVLCLDRAALYNLAADRFERALALYEQLLPLVDAEKGPVAARNHLVVHLARAAAALGAKKPQIALETLDSIERDLQTPGIGKTLLWPHATAEQVAWTYRLIASGLRAKAYIALEQPDRAAQALEVRRALYLEQLKRGPVDEHSRSLALVETQLAELALARNDGVTALRKAKAALEQLEPIVKKEGKPYDRDQLDVLWLAAEARISTNAKLKLQLRDRMGKGIEQLAAQADPKRRALLGWLEIYLGLLGKSRGLSAQAVPPAVTPVPQ
jgi:Tol biopolymer transport system component